MGVCKRQACKVAASFLISLMFLIFVYEDSKDIILLDNTGNISSICNIGGTGDVCSFDIL